MRIREPAAAACTGLHEQLLRTMTIVLILFFSMTGQGRAQISPGELSSFHEFLEGISHCNRCHEGEKGSPEANCMSCHGEILVQHRERKGYHWRIKLTEPDRACGDCHTEHNGRAFELVYWKDGMDSFDHSKTGYVLVGRHARLGCRECHIGSRTGREWKERYADVKPDRTFLGLDPACRTCHVDIHLAQFDSSCDACHGMDQWRPAALFDHDRSTYPLAGAHRNVDCAKCHPAAGKPGGSNEPALTVRYKGIRFDDCSSCHTYRHRMDFGKRCDDCHTSTGWHSVVKSDFDHGKTRFELKGRHQTTPCESCHGDKKAKSAAIEFERCVPCHKDVHTGGFRSESFVNRCELCHTEDRFVPATFGLMEHDRTGYPLTGAHRAVPCYRCHDRREGAERISFRTESTECAGCHTDPHRDQFSADRGYTGCSSCHSTSGWPRVNFDHKQTRFPLDGKHLGLDCDRCHPREVGTDGEIFVRYRPLPTTCRGCHEESFMATIPADAG